MLSLASPYQEGPAVRRAQQRLIDNRFGQDFLQDEIDGVFGPATARGCKRARYWLGWPIGAARRNDTYTDRLDAFLTGKKLPVSYRIRRRARLRRRRNPPLRAKALAVAIGQLDTVESPRGSNNVLYSRWYMRNEKGWTSGGPPWCAMFVTWCLVKAGSKAWAGLPVGRWAFCPFVANAAEAGEHGLSVTADPQPGDLVLYQFDSDANEDHIGFFERWTDRKAGRFLAIEGNTAVGNDANGGAVMRRERSVSQVKVRRSRRMFVHPSE